MSTALLRFPSGGVHHVGFAMVRASKIAPVAALLTLASPVAAQGVCFTPGATGATGDTPASIVTADFDGDGLADMAIGNQLSNSVSVILNLGGGSFAPQVQYATGAQPLSLTAADFDADGDLDLAIANAANSTFSVRLNQGTGTFGPQSVRSTNGLPWHITNADVTGDGRPDLLVADNSTSRISIFAGLGAGTFGPEVVYSVGVRPFWITSADLDGDGDLDLSVACSQALALSNLFNQGNGTFAPHVVLPLGREVSSVAAGDMNGDGAVDLVVAGTIFSAGLSSILVLRNHGNGTFAPEVSYPTAYNPHAVRCADMNGDGFLDVVDASYGNTAVLRFNLGSGTLGPQHQFLLPQPFAAAFCLDVADVDGNGRLDIVVPDIRNDRFEVFSNCGNALAVLCNGDGSGTTCPCGNNSPAGSQAGCRNSFELAGRLVPSGTASVSGDTLTLVGSGMATTTAVYFQGTLAAAAGAGAPFGNGLLCVAGSITRIVQKRNVNGGSRYPTAGDPPISVRGGVVAGTTLVYQVMYGR